MITERAVFVLGAGASKPYGYPTGAELRNEICSNFVNQYHANVLRGESSHTHREMRLRSVRGFTETFFKSSTKSIDLFLSRNPDFAEFGKLAIIASILDAEAKSTFREEMPKPDQDWYSHLFNRMTA